MNSISNTHINSDSSKEFYFFKFRDEDTEKVKKRQELNLEYQKFKLLDEEKFRNRFASKKVNKAEQMNEETTNKILTTLSEHPGDNIRILLNRLDGLQKDVEKLKQQQLHPEIKSNSNEDIKSEDQRIKAEGAKNSNTINEAVKHLNELENIIMALNVSESHETPEMAPQSPNFSKCLKDNFESKLHFQNSPRTSDSQDRLKLMKQEEYANDLRKQIEEKQRLKELERKKEMEEDQMKFAETHEFNSLGHRVRVKGEAVDPKSILLDTKHPRYARGGNGIFGDPLTETQKQANAVYRAELLSQIEEKK
ncbi:hypothetical protein TSMEX_002595, partial [Taenia solium]